ncbi:MAG: STAS domain-containing protein [Phenylobacterium sp.]|uniref:STAS domain-containing protein n=1 Tax=Phenylobacterium sp. TaxID=1871053 RepID=UPI00122440C6|nr:STAS domain-containing protein [Phenylobacterium sp.]TAJ74697.1 MAG: STAS domain-containing protein [Phenylobacterium sp.]
MSEHTLILGDSLEMTAAGPLHKALLARRGQPVTLDGSQVRRIGGQCLQVLLSAQATWAADGAAFQITDPSPEFADGLALMGASHLAPTAALSLVQD